MAEVVLCADKISLALNGWTISFPSLGNLTYMQQIADRGGGVGGAKVITQYMDGPILRIRFQWKICSWFSPHFPQSFKKVSSFFKESGWLEEWSCNSVKSAPSQSKAREGQMLQDFYAPINLNDLNFCVSAKSMFCISAEMLDKVPFDTIPFNGSTWHWNAWSVRNHHSSDSPSS